MHVLVVVWRVGRRVRLATRILGWPDLHPETVLRDFVGSHPFVALRPVDAD